MPWLHSYNGDCWTEVRRGLAVASQRLNSTWSLLYNTNKQMKVRILRAYIPPAATYGCESRTISHILKKKISAFKLKCHWKVKEHVGPKRSKMLTYCGTWILEIAGSLNSIMSQKQILWPWQTSKWLKKTKKTMKRIITHTKLRVSLLGKSWWDWRSIKDWKYDEDKIKQEIFNEQHGLTENKGRNNAVYILMTLSERTIEVKKQYVLLFHTLHKSNWQSEI